MVLGQQRRLAKDNNRVEMSRFLTEIIFPDWISLLSWMDILPAPGVVVALTTVFEYPSPSSYTLYQS